MLSYKEFVLEGKNMNVNMSLRDITNHITERGWRLVRNDGAHDIFAHEHSTLKVSVPKKHKNGIPHGTIKQILRKAATLDKK